MASFFLLGALGTGAYLATRPKSSSTLSGIFEIVANPAVFGLAAGVANGVLATVREKPMSVTVNLITAAVIGISEGVLTENQDNATSVGFLSALGAAAGMAAFTRFNPGERAIFENPATPLLAS